MTLAVTKLLRKAVSQPEVEDDLSSITDDWRVLRASHHCCAGYFGSMTVSIT
jgi:hypothetical protein